jgi:RNA polymerase sigma factor (TIGR02999 family)
MPSTHEITQLLRAWSDGDRAALDELIPLVQAELHRLARRYMSQERPGHTLQTTALVNEAYLRLIDWEAVKWQNRAHFFGVAAQLMRRILVDFARSRNRSKRGGQVHQVSLDEVAVVSAERDTDFIALDFALEKLAILDRRQSQIVELRFFGGLAIEEIAEVLHISPATVKRDLTLAKVWLLRELGRGTVHDA